MQQSVAHPSRKHLFIQDVLLISIMAVLAACGLIYEYLLSHYAGRVLGIMETAIYAMIGLMIVSMGLGAFAARTFKQPFTAFAWLEVVIATIGATAVLIIAGIIALTGTLPELVSQTFNLPPDTVIEGGTLEQLREYAGYLPYVAGFFLGFFIGMEIPLIARVRERVYGQHLENNAGTIYGADYIGAGFGALLWVTIMLTLDITTAAVWTASLNIVAGIIFLVRYWDKIRFPKALLTIHLLLVIVLVIVADSGARWMSNFANVLYKDHVIYQVNTTYQNITFTQRRMGEGDNQVIDMYLNGRLQFSSSDERIYHSMLIYPPLLASARQDHVLVIGGGDGLAVRDILKWSPKSVTLIDLDHGLVELYSEQYKIRDDQQTEALRAKLMQLNNSAFEDPRVTVMFGDAFIEIEKLLKAQRHFDTIIVDLPDPSHPDLNKLYSDFFYARLKQLLVGDGAMVVQSTSPYHAQDAFISIQKTVAAAGFQHVEQYRQNVPSFGEWGWTIATKMGQSAQQRIQRHDKLWVTDDYVDLTLIKAAFAMPANFYRDKKSIEVNHLGSGVLYRYHTLAWQKDTGVYAKGSQLK
ncbi:polyamine aminopropyltransferase [Pleionea sp. CnH1-48]|uniref:polyamine aminopropyltransferase n=1 Tax=Pleionea sp. CnH1-48 TaxID=2954494 RepID=UPI0020984CAC|nr:polyamine aminopropyltransferase [Pleionea sp. CnH1-48]MCO7226898.1 polyamine aminopropyltransferase [Pleionea sp. CnH1-48]